MKDSDAEKKKRDDTGPNISRRWFLGGAGAAAVGGPVPPNIPIPSGIPPEVFITMMDKFRKMVVKPGTFFDVFGNLGRGEKNKGLFESILGSREFLEDGRIPEQARDVAEVLGRIPDEMSSTKIGDIVKKDFLDVVYPASGSETPSQRSVDAFLKTMRALGLDENATLNDLKEKLAPQMADYVKKMMTKLPHAPIEGGHVVYGDRQRALQDLRGMVPDGEAYDELEEAVIHSTEEMYDHSKEVDDATRKHFENEIAEENSEKMRKKDEERQQIEEEDERQRQKESPFILCSVEESAVRKELISENIRVPSVTYLLRSESEAPNKTNVLKLAQQLAPEGEHSPGLIEVEPLLRTHHPVHDSLDVLVTVEKNSPLQKHLANVILKGENVWLPRTEAQKT